MDLMWLDHLPVRYVVYTHTTFQSAAVLCSKTVEDVCSTLLECSCTLYTRYPCIRRVDHASEISCTAFRRLSNQGGILLQFSGNESDNSIGARERYHQPLHPVFSVVRRPYPQLHPETALRMALKAMNDTMGPAGLVPTISVFGFVPTPPIISIYLRTRTSWQPNVQLGKKFRRCW